jgi:hypothetical protein
VHFRSILGGSHRLACLLAPVTAKMLSLTINKSELEIATMDDDTLLSVLDSILLQTSHAKQWKQLNSLSMSKPHPNKTTTYEELLRYAASFVEIAAASTHVNPVSAAEIFVSSLQPKGLRNAVNTHKPQSWEQAFDVAKAYATAIDQVMELKQALPAGLEWKDFFAESSSSPFSTTSSGLPSSSSPSGASAPVICSYCGKLNHSSAVCHKRIRDEKSAASQGSQSSPAPSNPQPSSLPPQQQQPAKPATGTNQASPAPGSKPGKPKP